jgi:hypothetical protein
MQPPDRRIARATTRDLGQSVPLFDAYRAFFASRTDGSSRRFLDAVGFATLSLPWSSW